MYIAKTGKVELRRLQKFVELKDPNSNWKEISVWLKNYEESRALDEKIKELTPHGQTVNKHRRNILDKTSPNYQTSVKFFQDLEKIPKIPEHDKNAPLPVPEIYKVSKKVSKSVKKSPKYTQLSPKRKSPVVRTHRSPRSPRRSKRNELDPNFSVLREFASKELARDVNPRYDYANRISLERRYSLPVNEELPISHLEESSQMSFMFFNELSPRRAPADGYDTERASYMDGAET